MIERMEVLLPLTGSQVDGYWHHLIRLDPAELLGIRIKQKVYLARYMRQSVFDWEHREVVELQAYFGAMSDIIGGENELNRAREDR